MGCAIGLALDYLKCRRCGFTWLDDPTCEEGRTCPNCGARGEDVEKLTGRGGNA